MAIEAPLSELQEHAGPSLPRLNGEDEISLLDILIVLAERKRTIVWVTAIIAVLAVIVSLILPKRYTATVTLLPPQQNSSMGAAMASTLGNLGGMAALAGGGLGIKSPNDMYVSMMRSRTVEEAMVQHFGLMQEYHKKYVSDACKAFEKATTIVANGKDGLIHISIEDRDAKRASELANGYVDQYRKLSEHLAITEASQRRLFFEQQLQEAKDNLEKAEEALKHTQQTTGLIQLDSQARALIETAATLRAQIAAKEVQIKSLQTFATDQNYQLVQARQELESLNAQLAKLGGAGGDSELGVIPSRGKVPEAGLEYLRKYRDVKYYETIFDILARQFEMAKLDEAREGALIQVVDPAAPPDKRSFPKRGVIVIAATFVGLFFGMVVAIVQAFIENMKQSSKNVLKLLRLRQALSLRRRVPFVSR